MEERGGSEDNERAQFVIQNFSAEKQCYTAVSPETVIREVEVEIMILVTSISERLF